MQFSQVSFNILQYSEVDGSFSLLGFKMQSFKCGRNQVNEMPSLDQFTSVKSSEVDKFNGVKWWDKDGEMKPLLSFNKIRVPFIRDGLLGSKRDKDHDPSRDLEGFQILDIGCGGGILSEGLGKLGAKVVGIDPGSENVSSARMHMSEQLKPRVTYHCSTIEEYAAQEPRLFDGVALSEVIEHVENPKEFLKIALTLVKPGGSVFITCPNRTVASWFTVILMAEYVLRILPIGTHSWKKFLNPNEIKDVLHSNGFKTIKMKGISYNPITNGWGWTPLTKIHYALHAIKPLC